MEGWAAFLATGSCESKTRGCSRVGGDYVEDIELPRRGVAHLRTLARRPRGDRHDRLRRSAGAARRASPSSPAPTWPPGSAVAAHADPTVPRRRCGGRCGRRTRALTSASRSSRSCRREPCRRRPTPPISSSSTTTQLPVVIDPRVGARRGAAPPERGHERRASGGHAGARRLRRVRGCRRGADRQPAADGGAHRGAFRAPPTGPTTDVSCTTRPARAPT